MEEYFAAVSQYVALAEKKVKELQGEFNKIGYDKAMLLEFDVFKKPRPWPKESGNALDDYFKLVNFYVATAVDIIGSLRNTLREKIAEFTTNKEEKKGKISMNLQALALNQADSLLTHYLKNKYNVPLNIQTLQDYLESSQVHFIVNYILNKWDEAYAAIDYYLLMKQIMEEYRLMKVKFAQVSKTDPASLPSSKRTQFEKAKSLFDDLDETTQKLSVHPIETPFTEEDQTLFKDYTEAREVVQEILSYLKGGVSQAFLILRNTNDVDRLGREETDKLLKINADNLFYLDNKTPPNILEKALNKFQGIFNQHYETEETRATVLAVQERYLEIEAAQKIKDNDLGVAKLKKRLSDAIKERSESESNRTNDAIHTAILSEKNYNLLEEGGTVIIIAYGQSGSGKTYTLTGLIQHFSDINYAGFTLEGISAVQFYNDVKLKVDPGGDPSKDVRRKTYKMVEGIPIPNDAAERANMKVGELALKPLDDMFNKTKMYDVHKLSRQKLKLKIDPVVTRLPELPENASPEMKRIQKYANACFDAAVEVNRIATSEPNKYGRLFETYRQNVLNMRIKKKPKLFAELETGLSKSEMILPIYVFNSSQDATYERYTLKDIGKKFVGKNYTVCSNYGLQSYAKSQLYLSQADLEELCDVLGTNATAYTHMKESVLTTCKLRLDDPGGNHLIEQYNQFIRMYRAVFILCDTVPVTKTGEVYQIGPYLFKNGIQQDETKTHFYKWTVEVDFVENTVRKNPPPLIYKKYIADVPTEPTLAIIFQEISDAKVSPNEEVQFPRGVLMLIKKNMYFIQIHLSAYKLTLHDEFLSHLFESKFSSDSVEPKIQLISITPETKNDKHLKMDLLVIVKKTETKSPEITFKDHPITLKPTVSDSSGWMKINKEGTYPYLSAITGGSWQTDLITYRAAFAHCIRISETGPDNASNYSLFDHTELLHANSFPKEELKIKSSYTETFDTPTVPFIPIENFKQKLPRTTPPTFYPKTLKDEYDEINAARFTRAMPQNPESSRSQLVTTLHLSKKGIHSKLLFIDLAGNEKVDITKKHIVTPESVYINSTLKFVTDMFLQMKQETDLEKIKPNDDADPFQKFLYQISTKTSVPGQKGGLKPAIVMVVCAYEYYSSWTPPRPTHEVSKESLINTFEFVSDLFSFEDKAKEGGQRPKYTRYLHKKKTRKRRPTRTYKR